jgi:hypothetical protein
MRARQAALDFSRGESVFADNVAAIKIGYLTPIRFLIRDNSSIDVKCIIGKDK